jgi:hypothetical protein
MKSDCLFIFKINKIFSNLPFFVQPSRMLKFFFVLFLPSCLYRGISIFLFEYYIDEYYGWRKLHNNHNLFSMNENFPSFLLYHEEDEEWKISTNSHFVLYLLNFHVNCVEMIWKYVWNLMWKEFEDLKQWFSKCVLRHACVTWRFLRSGVKFFEIQNIFFKTNLGYFFHLKWCSDKEFLRPKCSGGQPFLSRGTPCG